MSLALQHLGFLQRETGDLRGAVETLRRRGGAQPRRTPTAAGLLGAYLNESGRQREAADLLRVYAQRRSRISTSS